MILKIKGYPRPAYDETLTSWVFRCSQNKKLIGSSSIELKHILSDMGEFARQGNDPDFDFSPDYLVRMQDVLGFNMDLVMDYFSPRQAWILPWENRLQYCYKCFSDDISANKLPSWRKSWCYVSSMYCEMHNRELDFNFFKLSPKKPWDYFSEHTLGLVKSPEPPRRIERLWLNQKSSRLRRVLCGIIQRKFELKKQSMETMENFGDFYDRAYCLAVLISILLKERSPFSSAGIARTLYGFNKTKINRAVKSHQESIDAGVFECSTNERISAFVLAGKLTSALPDGNMNLIRSVFSASDFPFDINIRLAAGGSAGKKEPELVASILEKLNPEFLTDISEFFEGINS